MAAKPKMMELRFPTGGLFRRSGFQFQPPYTTPDCMNVRPFDTLDGRERGGSRPGLLKAFASTVVESYPVQLLAEVSKVGTTGAVTSTLVAIAAGGVRHLVSGSLTTIGAGCNADAARLYGCQMNQALYIADLKTRRVKGSDGTIASTNQLAATGISDWTALGIDKTYDWVLITNSQDADDDGLYAITAVAEGYITIDGTIDNGACSYELGRPVKIYDPFAPSFVPLVATYGTIPLNCPLICVYRGRLCLAGPDQLWYMSRQNDPTDWDWVGGDPDDPARPVAGSNLDGGQIGEPITAMIPFSDDYLIFGAENSLWMLRGDPAYSGQLDALSRTVGILSQDAHAKLPDGSLLFLSRDGLYLVAAGGSVPQMISREKLPAELRDVDASANVVAMCYDARDRGTHLSITPVAGTAGTHWWIDHAFNFWPASMPTGQQPRCYLPYAADQTAARYVLLGCHDSYIRRYGDTQTTDDGTAISSYMKIGPLTGGAGYDGILAELSADLDAGSGNVSWGFRVGSTAEAAIASSTNNASGTWAAGSNRRTYPRVRFAAGVLHLSSTARWAMESLLAVIQPGGRTR